MMGAFSNDVRRAAIDRIAVLFPSGRLVDTSADKVDPDDMEPGVDEGDYLGDLAEEEDDLGVRVSVPGVVQLEGFGFCTDAAATAPAICGIAASLGCLSV